MRLLLFGGALLATTALTVPRAVDGFASDVLPFTDSLRAEANRASSLSPRRTVVRRLSYRVDTAAVGCDTVRWATDSLRLEARRSPSVRRTVVRRLAYKADTLAASCDTGPAPSPTVTVRLAATDTVLRVRPATPYNVFITARVDSSGTTVSDSVAFTLSPALASSNWETGARRLAVFSAATAGTMYVVGTWGSTSDSVRVRVLIDSVIPTPPPPSPPTLPSSGWVASIDSLIGPIPNCGAAKLSSNAAVRRWVQNWETNEPIRWAADSSRWSAANYYDRAAIYYAMAACYSSSDTARAQLYLQRGHMVALDYRDKYLVPNDGGVQHHWMQLEGLALHFVLTGDSASRRMVGRTADVALGAYYRNRVFGQITHPDMENRIAQRAWLAALLARRLNVNAKNWTATAWPQKIDSLVQMTYRAQDTTTKLWCYRCSLPDRRFTAPFMDALLVDVARKYQRWYAAGPQVARLDTLARTTYTALRDSAFRADSSFHYNLTPSSLEGGRSATPDLNLFHVSNAYEVYTATSDTTYRDLAAKLFYKGVYSGWLGGSKQFNQAYYNSFRYVYYLLNP